MVPQLHGVAFSVAADAFLVFARSLPGAIPNVEGIPLTIDDLVDYERVRSELVERDGVRPQRTWPVGLYDAWREAGRRGRRRAQPCGSRPSGA
jgi:hypothetical protein